MSLIEHTLKPVSGTGYPGLAVGPARRAYEADMRAGRIDEVIRYHFPLDGLTPVAWKSRGKWNVVIERFNDLDRYNHNAPEQVAQAMSASAELRANYHKERE